MNKDNKNTEVNNTDKKLHISDVISPVCNHPINDRVNFFEGAKCYAYKCNSCNNIIRNYNIKYPYNKN